MSVGGKVIEVVKAQNKIWINTLDHKDECAIYVEIGNDSKKVIPGDIVWWQGNNAFWTTKDRKTEIETKLKRIGCSGVSRPE